MGYSKNVKGGQEPFSCYFSKEGSPGTINAIGDYSDTGDGVTKFICETGAGRKAVVRQVIASVADSGAFDPSKYGTIAALTNGVSLKLFKNGAVVHDFMASNPIVENGGWSRVMVCCLKESIGTGKFYLSYGFQFSNEICDGIYIEQDKGLKLGFVLNDDFDGIINQLFYASGYYVGKKGRYA